MENMEQYIGRKIKGFKFENKGIVCYNVNMDKHIGEIGVIKSVHKHYVVAQFKNEYWSYPIDLVIAQLKIQGDTKIITKEEATALIESMTGDKYEII